MQYKFYLDGKLVENPLGWHKMIRKVTRDKELKAVLLNLDADLTFQGDGYFYLKSLFDQSYCGQVKIDIYQSRDDGQTFYQRYSGTLFVTEMEFDEFRCFCKVRVTDSSYYAHISANKNIETSLLGGRSKNSPDVYNITPCRIQKFKLFDPTNCNYFSNTEDYGSFLVDDAIRYLIEFMTDKQVDYYSPVFGTGGAYQYLTMTFGYAIRHNGIVHDGGTSIDENQFIAHLPKISFQKLFDELNRFFNLGMYVETNPHTGRPRLVIDEWKNLFRQTPVTTFSNLGNLKVTTASQDIYSQVKFGGTTEDAPALSFPTGIRFIGFIEETFFTVTNCNVDNTLDLSGDFIVDTNVIEHISLTSIDVGGGDFGDTTYDKDWFFIDSTFVLAGNYMKAKQSNWLTDSPPCYYNELFTNENTSDRYFGFVPATIADYLGPSVDARFHAELVTRDPSNGFYTATQFTHIKYNDDSSFPPNFDTSASYNTGTFEFVAPADGGYTFYASANLWLISSGPFGDPISTRLLLKIRKYDSLSVLLQEYTIGNLLTVLSAGNLIPRFFEGTKTVFMLANEKVSISFEYVSVETLQYQFSPTEVVVGAGKSTFACIASVNGGGTYRVYYPDKYPIVKNKFTTEISKSQTDAIEANPLSLIRFFIEATNVKTGFVEEISIDEFNGTVEAVLIQGTGYPPSDPPCANDFGAFVVPNSDFASGDSLWIKLQNPANWALTTLGAQHIPPGSASPLDAIENTAMTSTSSPTGKWRYKVVVTNMTAGSFFIYMAGYSGTTYSADGTYSEVLDLEGNPMDDFQVIVSQDFDGLITLADAQPMTFECPSDCFEAFGANVLPNYGFNQGDDGNWIKNPTSDWSITNVGAQHFDDGDPLTDDNINTTAISNQTSPTNKWRIKVRVTGRTQGHYYVNAAGYTGTWQFANGTYEEILDLAGDPLNIFFVIVSGDFDGTIHIVTAEPLLNEC